MDSPALPVPERPSVHDSLPAIRPLLVDHPLQGTTSHSLLLDVQSSPFAAESPFDLTSTTDAFHRLSFADLLPAEPVSTVSLCRQCAMSGRPPPRW